MKKSQYNEILNKNEEGANSLIVRLFLIMLGVLTVILALNVFNVFVLDSHLMIETYIICAILLILPMFVNSIKKNRWIIKYYITFTAVIVMSVLTYSFTYHVIIIAVFPIVVANIYFIQKMNIWAIGLTVVLSAFMQIMSFLNGKMTDKNFETLDRLILYGILPRTVLLLALSTIFYFLNRRTAKLLESFVKESKEVEKAHNRTVMGFANIVESRDDNTGGHVRRTSKYVEMIAKEMKREGLFEDVLTDEYVNKICLSAPLHDVGKITVPDKVLLKQGKLDDNEYEEMKKHTVEGGKMIKKTFSDTEEYAQTAYEVAMNHHEKWNGKGYPEGKKGEEIPLSARIMAVADVFDALSQDRCYRKAMTMDECFEIIEKGRGESFDPRVVDAFVKIREEVEEICKNC